MKRKRSSRQISFTNPPLWLEDDYLSNLPEDCLHDIHNYLDKYSLESLAATSQRMYRTVYRQLSKLLKCKRRLQTLEILRNSKGHALVASGGVDDHFIYHLDQTDPTTHYFFTERVNRKIERLNLLNSVPLSHSSMPVIVQSKIREFMRKNQFDELRLNGVTLDSVLLRSLKLALSVKLKRVSFCVDYCIQSSKSFFKWIIDSGAEDVSFTVLNGSIRPHFDEQFLTKFAGERRDISLRIDLCNFHFPVKSIDFFKGFNLLIHHSLVLSDTQFVTAVNTRLSEPFATGNWEFSIYFATPNPFFLFQLDSIKMARLHESGEEFTCGRSDNSNSVRIVFRPVLTPSDSLLSLSSNYLLISVFFYSHNEWLT